MRKWLLLGIVVMFASAALSAAAQQPSGQAITLPGADAFSRAQQALQAQDYSSAVVEASLFILLNPTYSQGYYLRGIAYAQLGDADRALADLERALRYPAPDAQFTASLYNIRSMIHAQQGSLLAALDDLSTGIEAAPDTAELYVSRGDLYGAQGELDLARADYTKAIELDNTSAAAYSGRALVSLWQDNLEAALDDYTRALDLNPQDVTSLARRAGVYLRLADYDRALSDVDRALELNPDEASFYLTRGAAHNGLRQGEPAAAAYHEWLNRVGSRVITYQRLLNPGESIVVPLSAGTLYRFPVAVQPGQTLRLSASARDGAATDPLLVLLDAQESPVAADDDGGGAMNARIDAYQVLLESGTYTLLLGHAGGSPDGPVRVLLEIIPG